MKKVMLTLALGTLLLQAPAANASVLSGLKDVANGVKTQVTRVVTNLVNAGKTVVNANINMVKTVASDLTK